MNTEREEYPRDEFRIIQTPGNKEPSEITVTSNGCALVHLGGPMSVYAAGAFIKALEDKENHMNIAREIIDAHGTLEPADDSLVLLAVKKTNFSPL